MTLAPFPYPGGKSRIAEEVWRRLGDPPNYVDPFFGSGAVLLARPDWDWSQGKWRDGQTRVETVNDADGLLCLAPETRLLRGDLTWGDAGDIREGDTLVGFDESNGAPRSGLQAPEHYRHWRLTQVTAVRRVVKPCYRLSFDDGTMVVASEDHLWLSGSHRTGGRGWRWVATKGMVANRATQRSWVLKLVPVVRREESWEAGWLAGLLDGEGSVSTGAGWRLMASQNPGPVLDQAKRLLEARGFAVAQRNYGDKACSLDLHGGMREILRLLMLIRPERLVNNTVARLPNVSLYGRSHQAVGLTRKEYIGGQAVVAVETDCHTFIAEGLASHNCNFWRALKADPEQVAHYADWPVSECVPAGTMIATPTGELPIEDIRPGMVVLGERSGIVVETTVIASRQSKAADFYGVGPLRLTSNHPVWTVEHGYVPASQLTIGATVAVLNWPVGSVDTGCQRGVGQPSDPQRLPMQRESLSVPIGVYNLQTSSGNYFAASILVHNCDLTARHIWLVGKRESITARLEGDPEWYDAKAAGWWVWGICCWIGSGWCSGKGPWSAEQGKLVHLGDAGQGVHRQLVHLGNAGRGVNRQLVHLGDAGRGVNRKLVHLGDAGRGVNRQLVHLGDAGRGVNRKLVHLGDAGRGVNRQLVHLGDAGRGVNRKLVHLGDAGLFGWFEALAARLRRVRVCCGDWRRVLGPSPTTHNGLTAVFLDPPYRLADRAGDLYAVDADVWDAVRDWATLHGDDPRLRIALCGYVGEVTLPADWEQLSWSAQGGYGAQGDGPGRENRHRECVWFSRHALRPERAQQLELWQED